MSLIGFIITLPVATQLQFRFIQYRPRDEPDRSAVTASTRQTPAPPPGRGPFHPPFSVAASRAALDADGKVAAFRRDTMRHYDNREMVLAAVKQYGVALRDAGERLKADRQIVLAAVDKRGMALRYATKRLKVDLEVVLVAVKQNGHALQYATKPLKANREVVLAAVDQNGMALRYAAEPLRADREVVLAAVKLNGLALEHAAEPLKADREIVMAAVKQYGMALQYAAEPLKGDRGVVLAAVQKDHAALRCTTVELRADVQVVLTAVKSASVWQLLALLTLQHASKELQDDSYLQRLVAQSDRPMRLRAFLKYARDLHESTIKAKVDLWLTCYNNGELHHWMDATHVGFKRRKRVQLDELADCG